MNFFMSSLFPFLLGLGLAITGGGVLIAWAYFFLRAGGVAMERPYWGTQFYAYSMCIIAVVVFLFTLTTFLSNAFEAAQPLRARGSFGGAILTSFDAYKATYQRD